MQIDEFIKNFTDQLMNPPVASLAPETRFRDIDEWSSLTALLIIVMIDEVYKVKMNGDDIRNSVTLEDLFTIVKSRI